MHQARHTISSHNLVIVYSGVKHVTGKIPSLVERTNNAVYDALTPDALQRNVLKYSAILAIKNDAYYSYKRGVVYFLQGKYEYAITDLENCIKWSQSSEMYQAHYYRGLILTRLARYREAVDAYTSAIETFSEATETKSTVVDSLRSTKRSISFQPQRYCIFDYLIKYQRFCKCYR